MTTTGAAYLTTDPSALEGDLIDVLVLTDDAPGGPAVAQFTTSVRYDGDHYQAWDEAREGLRDLGWDVTSAWTATPTGYLALVERR